MAHAYGFGEVIADRLQETRIARKILYRPPLDSKRKTKEFGETNLSVILTPVDALH